MVDCLSNAVVVRLILQHFSNPELLKLSFVNKLWNHEARSVIKNRGNLTPRLKFHDKQPCQKYLKAFAADLGRMNVVPFSGIRIELGHRSQACRIEARESIYQTILDKLPFKSVSVDLGGAWFKNKVCPGCVLGTTILQNVSEVLEEVSLAKHWPQQDSLIVWFVKYGNFSTLKILKLGENYGRFDENYLTSMLRAVVARAPKLQELHTQGPINVMLNALEGSAAVLGFQSNVSAPFDGIPDNGFNAIRPTKMRLHYEGPNFNVERFNRITPMLLQAPCSSTLRSIDMDAVLAVPFMCFGIRLENVISLSMKINHSHLERLDPRILRIVKNFDFTRIFPSLEEVGISLTFDDPQLSSDHMNGFVEQANASLHEPEPDRAINIKELELSTGIAFSDAEFYCEMFPHIQTLRVKEESGEIFFGSIWKHWVNLKKLYAFLDVQKHYEDLESVICGIFPEEVAELRQKDEEFLKKVNIVPVMPSINCLRNLRMFTLFLAPLSDPMQGFRREVNVEPVSPPQLILSKVTGLVAFARCPGLIVSLLTYVPHVYEGLRQMEPYATVHCAGGH